MALRLLKLHPITWLRELQFTLVIRKTLKVPAASYIRPTLCAAVVIAYSIDSSGTK